MRWLATREMVTIRALRDQENVIVGMNWPAKGSWGKGRILKSHRIARNSLTNKFLCPQCINHAVADEREELVELINRLYQLHRPQ
jgi:glutamyl-tRNA reductase